MTDAGPLLVPIQLDAFALVSRAGQVIRRPAMKYVPASRRFVSPEPAPFEGEISQSADELGVYLMWTLPAALRRGVQKDPGSGAVEFPYVPNRWLVVRTLTTAASPRPETTAWVVESDYTGSDGTSEYADPDTVSPTPLQLGKRFPLATWAEQNAARKPFLRAVAPGNPAFAAFQSDSTDVFSIFDPLTGADRGTVDYFVAGWYAGDGDPLATWEPGTDGGYAGVLDRLQWAAPDPADRTATRSIYHGLLLNLLWDRNGDPPTSARDGVKPALALGNTSTDALVALLKEKGLDPADAELLEAFTLDLLGELQRPGGEAILQRRLHASWFAPEAGGYVWDSVDAPTAPGDPPHDPLDAQEVADETALLARLNADQARLDDMRRQLAALQRELYELWWKRGFAKVPGTRVPAGLTDQALKSAQETLAAQVTQLAQEIETLAAALPDPNAATSAALKDTRRLTASLAPRFYAPTDPVLLVGGLGHDLVIDPSATLACRYSDAVLTAIGSRTRASVSPPALGADVPPDIAPLLTEFALLRDDCASDRAAFADRIGTATVQGSLPELPLRPWEQPWLPLYLEWSADWHALPANAHWTFDGQDFSSTAAPPANATVLAGRALLTPGLAYAIRSRLDRYVAGDPANAALQTLAGDLDRISGWDFLSQTLDGFTAQVAWRDPRAARAPDPTIGPLVGANAGAALLFHSGGTFEGMRAGRFALTRVSIVDRFGQTLDLVGTGVDAPVVPAISAGLTPGSAAPDDVAELAPRLLQGARLRIAAGHTDGSLCGFLVPNHIDRGLAAYDATGSRLGELRLVATGAGPAVVWDPAPLDAELESLEADVAAVLRAVKDAGPGAFENFLTTIDETLWTIDPLAAGQDDDLTALASRPLAVVEAELAFELDGPPLRDPGWEHTLNPVDPPFLGYAFPVKLGTPADREDGLVGYFCDSGYARFHAVRVPLEDDLVQDPEGFVTAAAADDVTLRFDGSTVARVTLLVDPRGEVQAHTGLLPTAVLSLPRTSLMPALSVRFRAGPLLADQPPADGAGAPLMPTPTASARSWRWIEVGGPAPAAFPTVDDRARFSTLTPTAREGFVQVDPTGGQ